MVKNFEYKGRTFIFKITLNHSAERRPNGIVKHKLTIDEVSDAKDSYSKEYEVEDKLLLSKIGDFENVIKKIVDDSNPEQKLIDDLIKLGFNNENSIEVSLLKEAEIKGFKKGVTYKSLYNNEKFKIKGDLFVRKMFKIGKGTNSDEFDYYVINHENCDGCLYNGKENKWAEIIK